MLEGKSSCHWLPKFFQLFSIVCLVSVCLVCNAEKVCRQGVFRCVKDYCLKSNVISQHSVRTSLDCGQHCLQKDSCVGFKYRSSKNNRELNCQIGNKLESCSQADVTGNTDGDWTIYKILDIPPSQCLEKNPCQNGGTCVASVCEPDGYKCVCAEYYSGTFCEQIPESCKSLLQMSSNTTDDGPYKIKTETTDGFSNVYCQMKSVTGCSGGGWTMVMKIDGNKDTFCYNSSYWSNNSSYNLEGGITAFDYEETKLPTYWSTPFEKLCIGMRVSGGSNGIKFVSIDFTADSLYSLFADDKYRGTSLGRQVWKSLIPGSSLQHNCDREGFNVALGWWFKYARTRLGIVGNEQNDCNSPDSFIGFGGKNVVTTGGCYGSQVTPTICGNLAGCFADNGNRDTKAMGYILVR